MAANGKNHSPLLTATDRITLGYILFTTLLLLAGGGRLEHPGSHYLVRAGMITLVMAVAWLDKETESRWARFLHAFYPLLFLGYFFPETDYLNDLFQPSLDPAIIRLEMILFGTMPSLTFSSCCPWPWFSELMHTAYFSFYVIILFFALRYFFRHPRLFRYRMFQFFLAFYSFYVIFSFFPSEGPQYFLMPPDNVVPHGYVMTELMNRILEMGDRPTGAFPSSHIGMTWLIMYFFFRDDRRAFYGWLVPALLLTLATVYIKAHYAVDVLGGFMMVPLLAWLGQVLYPLLEQETATGTELVAEPPVVPPVT